MTPNTPNGFPTSFKLGDVVKFKTPYEDEVGVTFVIVDDPSIQSISTCNGESPARVDIVSTRALLDKTITFKPRQTVNLDELEIN